MQFVLMYLSDQRIHRTIKGNDTLESVYDILSTYSQYEDLCKKLRIGESVSEKEFEASGVYMVNCTNETKYVVVDVFNPIKSYASTHTKYRNVLEDAMKRFTDAFDTFKIMTYTDNEIERVISDKSIIITI